MEDACFYMSGVKPVPFRGGDVSHALDFSHVILAL
jgi:hypothetical protein